MMDEKSNSLDKVHSDIDLLDNDGRLQDDHQVYIEKIEKR